MVDAVDAGELRPSCACDLSKSQRVWPDPPAAPGRSHVGTWACPSSAAGFC